jgi:universal stress protein A
MKSLNIVVPIDFTECSLAGLEKAVEMVRELGGRIYLLNVIADVTVEAMGRDMTSSHHILNGTLLGEIQERFAELAPHLRDCNFKTAVHVGRPSRAIVSYANKIGADMIVMATHGRCGVARLVLGSTAEEVVRTAGCPVLTVHPDAAHRALARPA